MNYLEKAFWQSLSNFYAKVQIFIILNGQILNKQLSDFSARIFSYQDTLLVENVVIFRKYTLKTNMLKTVADDEKFGIR